MVLGADERKADFTEGEVVTFYGVLLVTLLMVLYFLQ
jgi:hypothetical protein